MICFGKRAPSICTLTSSHASSHIPPLVHLAQSQYNLNKSLAPHSNSTNLLQRKTLSCLHLSRSNHRQHAPRSLLPSKTSSLVILDIQILIEHAMCFFEKSRHGLCVEGVRDDEVAIVVPCGELSVCEACWRCCCGGHAVVNCTVLDCLLA